MIERVVNGTLVQLSDEERQPCEIWSRVMGYFRPVESYNIGKKQEFADRTLFKEPELAGEIVGVEKNVPG